MMINIGESCQVLRRAMMVWIRRRLRLKSLHDIWYTVIVFILQTICLRRAYTNLVKFDSQTWQPYSKPFVEIYFYAMCVAINLVMLPLFIWSSLFKVGLNASDRFRFGLHLETEFVSEKFTLNTSLISKSDRANRITQLPFHKLLFNKLRSAFVSNRNFKQNMVPLSSLVQLIISIGFLFPKVLLLAREIQYGLLPKGHIHHSELDFMFTRPYQQYNYFNTDRLTRQNESYRNPLIDSHYESSNEINYQPFISIELFNLALSLLMFTFNYSTCLWHLNRWYAFMLSLHLVLKSSLFIIMYSSFEILYKFLLCFSQKNAASSQVRSQFVSTPTSLVATFIATLVLLVLSSVPIFALAVSKYQHSFRRLHGHFLGILFKSEHSVDKVEAPESSIPPETDQSDVGLSESHHEIMSGLPSDEIIGSVNKNVGGVASAKSLSIITDQRKSSSDCSSSSTSTTNTGAFSTQQLTNSNPESNKKLPSHVSMLSNITLTDQLHYTSYKCHVLAILLLVSMCLNCIFMLYDCILLFKLTNDSIPFWSIILFTVFIVWYTFLWLYLTFSNDFKIKFSQTFKLNYWYFLNKLMKSRPNQLGLKLVLDNNKANLIHVSLNANNINRDEENNESDQETKHFLTSFRGRFKKSRQLKNSVSSPSISYLANSCLNVVNEVKKDGQERFVNRSINMKRSSLPKKPNSTTNLTESQVSQETPSSLKLDYLKPMNLKAGKQSSTSMIRLNCLERSPSSSRCTKKVNTQFVYSNFKQGSLSSHTKVDSLKLRSDSPMLVQGNTNEPNTVTSPQSLVKLISENLVLRNGHKRGLIPSLNSDKGLIRISQSNLNSNKILASSQSNNNFIYLNCNEADSGRDSMADSPCSALQPNKLLRNRPTIVEASNKPNHDSSSSFVDRNSNKATGAFMSKCILLSSGNSVTLEQSLNKLLGVEEENKNF